MLRIAITFDALNSDLFVDMSHGKHFLQCPLAVVQDANEFEDVDLWKNCGNVTAFFQTSCRNMISVCRQLADSQVF